MKFTKKNIIYSIFSLCLISFFAMSFLGQESKESTKLLAQLQNPNSLLAVWDSVPMSLNAYSVEEIAYQKQLNEAEDGIMTYAPLQGDSSEWTVFDYQDITPTTWKVIALEVQKEDGSVSEVELRRPNWWLRQAKADKIGNKIYLELHEVNIIGWATIKAIYPNLIDTRLWEGHRKGDYVSRPATGRFVHQTDNVVSYYFSGADTAIEATPNHPFYSEDRKGWVEVGNLEIGEKVRNKSNKLVTLLRKEQQTKTQKVYNLEIYRNHNYLVGEQGVLVHNHYIRNKDLAGKRHPKTNVPFDSDGYPDFSDYSIDDVIITPTKDRAKDFAAANAAAGYTSTPAGYTWHHHQDYGRMQLVEFDIHKRTGHTGGFSLWPF
jgi:hypothetical protein